jgi:hypothetical protein
VRELRRSRRIRFQPDSIIDCITESLLAPQVAFRRLHRNVPQRELNLLQFPTGLMAKTGASPALRSWGARAGISQSFAFCFTIPQMTLGLKPVPQTLPALLIERRRVPAVIPEAAVQASIPAFTQSGTGMVRMWPPLPTRSAMTQCSSLCCMSSTRNAVNSAQRSPQPSRIASVA